MLLMKGRVCMKSVITIGREFGSGGREIGQKLASHLDIPFYDKEILKTASVESGISEDYFYTHDENHSNSLLYSLVMGTYPIGEGARLYNDMPLNHKIFLAQFECIRKLAEKGPCVLVGRCADYILREYPNVIRFFINGSMEDKKVRVRSKYEVEEKKLEDYIKKTDKRRSAYYNYYTDQRWGEAKNYDLCINSSSTGIDGAVLLMKAYIDIIEHNV